MEIPGAPYRLVRIRIASYQGEPIVLPDGTQISPNATIAQVHCDNQAILDLVQKQGNPFAACREDMKSLSAWIQHDALGRQIDAFYARSILINAARRLGFIPAESPITMHRRLERFFFKGLLMLYNRDGLARIARGSTPRQYPADLWLSRRALIRRYGERGAHHKAEPPGSSIDQAG